MTLRTAFTSLTLATSLVACASGAPTEHEVEEAGDAVTLASPVICQNVFDAAVGQPNRAPVVTLTWIHDGRAILLNDVVSLPNSSRVTASGDIAHGVHGFGELEASYGLVFRKRFITLSTGARLPQSSVLDFEIVTPAGATLTSFSSVPTECVTQGSTTLLTATGADGSRLVANFTRVDLGG